MKKYITVLAVLVIVGVWSCTAFADSPARDGMVAYSGTQAFERLTPEERQACVNWLVRGGEMDALCRQAVMRLVSEAPDAVLPEQRQALIAEASGSEIVQETPPPPPAPEPPKVVKKDNTGAIIAAGVVGIIAGMIIHNNVGGSRRDDPPPHPHYRPLPPGHHPHAGPPPRPAPIRRPPAPVHRPPVHRPPHR